MLKKRNLRSFVDSHIEECGGNLQEGLQSFTSQLEEGIENEGLSLKDVSLKGLYEAMVNRNHDLDPHNTQEISEAMTAAGFPTIVGQLIHPVTQKEFQPMVDSLSDMVTETTSTRPEENTVGFGAIDSFELVRENTPYEEAQILERKATIKNNKFGKIISVTMEMIMFDQTSEALRRAQGIGRKGGQHYHQMVIERATDSTLTALNETTSQGLIVDGTRQAMYSSDHSSWDFFANDNLNNAALDHNGLNAALTLFPNLTDDKGDVIMVMPDVLLVPKALETVAKQLLGSTLQYDTANNAVNPFTNAFKIISSVFLDSKVSATAWFLGDFKSQLLAQWVYRLRTESLRNPTQKSFESDVVAQFKSGYYVGIGNTDYRYVVKGNA